MKKNELDKIAELFENSNKITVFTGAGISTSCGIPDFRGVNGLYSIAQKKYNLPYPEAIFDIHYFKDNPEPFFNLSKDFFSTKIKPSITHKFIAWLEEINKISLVMTQNIDMLHRTAGNKKIIECHGTYETAHCISCKKEYTLEEIKPSLSSGIVPFCQCSGLIKPDIVFFGEPLPDNFYKAYHRPPETDLLLIMGTSLAVQPAASFALKLSYTVPSIIVNNDKTEYDELFTHVIHENLDVFIKKIWDKLKHKIK